MPRGNKKTKQKSKNQSVIRKEKSSLYDYKFSLRDVGNLAATSAGIVSTLAGFFNTEYKSYSLAASGTSGTTAVVTNLSRVAQGVAINNRVGNSIRCNGLYIAGRLQANAADATGHIVRVLVVADLGCAGAAPTANAVLDTTNYPPPSAVYTPVQPINEKRFMVLVDQRLELSTQSPVKHFAVGLPYQEHCLFLGNAGTDADLGLGQLFCIIIADDNTNAPTYAIYSQIRFVDD